MAGGSYTLLVACETDTTVAVGALGDLALDAGWYAYSGTALGSGGFARVDRHRRVAAGEHDVRHWHVDHLLGADATHIAAVYRTPEVDAECEATAALAAVPDARLVDGFGASDCDCDAHLLHCPRRAPLEAAARRYHATEV
jgi:Uri superfamily endonuclease